VTLGELFSSAHQWLEDQSLVLLGVAVLVPAIGTGIAWIGRGGSTDRDGRLYANFVVGLGVGVFTLGVFGAAGAAFLPGASVLDTNAVLLAVPVVWLVVSLVGIHLVFPLNELASVQSLKDVGLLVVVLGIAGVALWQFRGWGILFRGGLIELAVIIIGFVWLIRRLYRRVFTLG
jgi:hypothetical protein